MAHSKRNSQPPVIKFKGNGSQVSSFRVDALKIFHALLTADVEDEVAWFKAGNMASDMMRQRLGCPIVSRIGSGYDGQPMNGTATKSKKGTDKKPVNEDDFHVVVARGIARFIEQRGLSLSGADKEYGFTTRYIYRLVKETTPGLIGENIDKVCRAFEITRQNLIDLGTPAP